MLKAKQVQIKIQKIIVKNIVVRGNDRKFHKKNILLKRKKKAKD